MILKLLLPLIFSLLSSLDFAWGEDYFHVSSRAENMTCKPILFSDHHLRGSIPPPSSQPSVIPDPVEEDNSYDFTHVRETLLQEQYRILAKAENALKKKAWHESVKDCSLAALETIQDIYKDMTDRPLFYGSHFLRLYQAQNFWFFFVEKLSKVVLKEKTPVQDPCA